VRFYVAGGAILRDCHGVPAGEDPRRRSLHDCREILCEPGLLHALVPGDRIPDVPAAVAEEVEPGL